MPSVEVDELRVDVDVGVVAGTLNRELHALEGDVARGVLLGDRIAIEDDVDQT